MRTLTKKRWFVSPDIKGEHGAIPVVAHDIAYNAGGVEFRTITSDGTFSQTSTSSFYPYHSFSVLWHDEDYDPNNPSY